jgi:hypothetical protein
MVIVKIISCFYKKILMIKEPPHARATAPLLFALLIFLKIVLGLFRRQIAQQHNAYDDHRNDDKNAQHALPHILQRIKKATPADIIKNTHIQLPP